MDSLSHSVAILYGKLVLMVSKNAYLTLFLVRMSQIILKEDNYLSRFMAAVGRYCYTQWHAVP